MYCTRHRELCFSDRFVRVCRDQSKMNFYHICIVTKVLAKWDPVRCIVTGLVNWGKLADFGGCTCSIEDLLLSWLTDKFGINISPEQDVLKHGALCHYKFVAYKAKWRWSRFITRGQFWPSGIVITCVCVSVSVCVCVSLCVNHLLVCAITVDPFKLGPYCFGGQLTLTFKVIFNLKARIYPILSLFAS